MYIRNLVAGWFLYFLTGFAWAGVLYYWKKDTLFKDGEVPTWEDMRLQMKISVWAMLGYTLMPTWGEWLQERGWTRAYYNISSVGGIAGYLGWLAAYIFFVVS